VDFLRVHSWNANVSWILQSTSLGRGIAWYWAVPLGRSFFILRYLLEWWREKRELWMREISVSDCSPWWSGLQGSRNFGIPRMNLDTEETRETQNIYIESPRGCLKNICQYNILYNFCSPCVTEFKWYSNTQKLIIMDSKT